MHVRSLFAVALAALLVGPATVHAQAKKTSAKAAPARAAAAPAQATMTTPNYSIGGWIGYEGGESFGGVQFRGDFVWPFERLAPGLDLSFVGSVGLSRLTNSYTAGGFFSPYTVDATAWEFKLVPTARFTYTFNPQWSVFGDAGLGLDYTSVSLDTNFAGSSSASSTGLMLRIGGGGFFAVTPRVKLGAMLVWDGSTGSENLNTTSILAGANFLL